MSILEQIITDEQMNDAWGNANFGSTPKRLIISNSLLKCACGFGTGHTAKTILQELALVTSKWTLTKKR